MHRLYDIRSLVVVTIGLVCVNRENQCISIGTYWFVSNVRFAELLDAAQLPFYLVGPQPVLGDVGLVVGDGHPVTHTQHVQQVQVTVVLKKNT